MSQRMELLAPAGELLSLQAALDAGADAVYLGVTSLNARRGARNFAPDELASAVRLVHDRGAKTYLTLNIDLAQRELGQAARILELARQAGVNAVLVRDPALLALKDHYPELPFHFSTQTCMTNSADVAAAGLLGASRVVLARELSLREIAAASAVPLVQTEVFVQGALCFCVSGRCLLASWAGGRSGNRGTCTSPCRVPWTVQGMPAGTPLSMRDLTAVHRINDLKNAGVTALKIEGRLKSAAWVAKAVSLYRRALDGGDAKQLLDEAQELGAYTGRALTCDYLDGTYDQLTGVALGRQAAVEASVGEEEAVEEKESITYDLDITIDERGITCRCAQGDRSIEWSVPRTHIRRAHKAVPVAEVFRRLAGMTIGDFHLGKSTTNDEQFLLVPRAVNALMERIAPALRQLSKGSDDQVRIDLPEVVRRVLAKDAPSPDNRHALGDRADRVRLEAKAVGAFFRRVRARGEVMSRPSAVIVEGVEHNGLDKVLGACPGVSVVAALPAVFFEEDLPAMRQLVAECRRAGIAVEANSWGGWWLAREADVMVEAGPGMGVLNSLAARVLGDLGMRSVTLSVEADRHQLEEATRHCAVPCSMVIYGRPALMVTRVRLDSRFLGQTFTDRRGVRIVPRLERGLWVFRPAEAFDLRTARNDRIRVQHLVVDLVGAEDPAGEWLSGPPSEGKLFRFNYGRSLV